MPPSLLFDISSIDLDAVLYDQEAIRQVNPHRGDMEHLNGIVYVDENEHRLIGYKDIRADEFWVPGHIPGRPLFPGVLMIEAGAQLASFYTKAIMKWPGFTGFGGVDAVKFRQQVTPPCRMYLLGQRTWARHQRVQCKVQGIINGAIVFEGDITGVII